MGSPQAGFQCREPEVLAPRYPAAMYGGEQSCAREKFLSFMNPRTIYCLEGDRILAESDWR
jgi:hypothetical protein